MRRLKVFGVAIVCVCAAMGRADAQRELVFAGVPWRVTGDSATRLIRQRGFTYSRQIEEGDLEYRRGDGTLLLVSLQGGRLVGITLIDPARGAAVTARHQVLADSLRTALGQPDTVARGIAVWEAALTTLELEHSHAGSAPHAELRWHGPGWYDEMNRRAEAERPGQVNLSPRPPGYTIVSDNVFGRIAVDTTRLARLPGGVLHGRFRIEYVRSVGPDTALYDSAEYDMDFDCAGKRTRLTARTTRLKGQVRRGETFRTLPWETPRPDGHYDRGLRAICRVMDARALAATNRAAPGSARP